MKFTTTVELTRREVTAVIAFQKRLKEIVPFMSKISTGDLEVRGKTSFSNMLYKLHMKDTVKLEISVDYSDGYVVDTLSLADKFIKDVLQPALTLMNNASGLTTEFKDIMEKYPMDNADMEVTGELKELDLDEIEMDIDNIYNTLKDEIENS